MHAHKQHMCAQTYNIQSLKQSPSKVQRVPMEAGEASASLRTWTVYLKSAVRPQSASLYILSWLFQTSFQGMGHRSWGRECGSDGDVSPPKSHNRESGVGSLTNGVSLFSISSPLHQQTFNSFPEFCTNITCCKLPWATSLRTGDLFAGPSLSCLVVYSERCCSSFRIFTYSKESE